MWVWKNGRKAACYRRQGPKARKGTRYIGNEAVGAQHNGPGAESAGGNAALKEAAAEDGPRGAGQGAGSVGSSEALKEAASEDVPPAARPGAESAGGDVKVGTQHDEPGAESAIGTEAPKEAGLKTGHV